jgi:hypothetical protein
MASLIQIRRGTLAEWQEVNPVLSNGEITFVTDENKIKVGDGTTSWSSLPYLEATIDPDSIVLGQDTTGDYIEIISSGDGILVTGSGSESASVTIENTGVLSLVGTENEVSVSSSAGNITLTLPETINANTTGTAASLTTARTISLGGDLSGSASFSGSENITINATVDSQSSVNSITGTENEISVSASVGDVTLSLPETINANTTGSAAQLTNARAISLSGDLSGSVTFDGSASVDISAIIQPNSVELGTDTTGNYVATASAGTGIVISGSGSENSAITITNDGITSLTGTSSQISVSASNGDATLSLPSAVTFPGTVTLNADPTQPLQAATKQYVDEVAQGLVTKPSALGATVSNVSGIYDNGSSGVGATLTHDTDGVFPPTSGGATGWQIGSGILLKNQTNKEENGRYYISDMGSLSTPYVLTRCGFCDEADEIPGAYIFVQSGTYEGTGWIQVVDDPTTFVVGTDDINVYQFSGAGTYTAGSGLNLDGTQFSNTGVLSLTGTANEIEVSASSGNIVVSLPTTINADTTGSAASLTTSRTIELTGDVTGSASFNGGANASISATIAPNSVALGTDTTGNYVATISGTTNQVTVSGSGSENSAVTLSLPSTINVGTTGNAATATKLTTERAIALTGDVTGTANFDGSASAGISTTLANTAVTPASYGSASAASTFTVDAKGRLTAASSTPISIDQSSVTNLSTDLGLKANLASPTFTGVPIAPTATSGTDTTQIATTEYVQNELSSFSTLPDQTGNAGEFLTTDGTNASWAVLNVQPTIHPMFIIGGV